MVADAQGGGGAVGVGGRVGAVDDPVEEHHRRPRAPDIDEQVGGDAGAGVLGALRDGIGFERARRDDFDDGVLTGDVG